MRAPSSPPVLLIVETLGLAHVHNGPSLASTGLGTAVADTPQQEDCSESMWISVWTGGVWHLDADVEVLVEQIYRVRPHLTGGLTYEGYR